MIIWLSVLFGLISMAAYGSANAYSKPLSKEHGPAQTLFLRGFTISFMLGLLAIPSFHYLHNWQTALAALLIGAVGYLPVLAFTHGIKESPIGVVAPIAGTSPLITVLLSFLFLAVSLHTLQWFAVIVVITANIAVSINLKNWRQSALFKRSSGIPFALVASLGWGIFFFLLVPISKTLGPWLVAFLVETGVTVAAGLHLILSGQNVRLKAALRPAIILNGLLICIGTLCYTAGVRYFNIGIVAALSNTTAVMASILGVYLFHEKLRLKERVASFIMILGIVVISAF